MKTTLAILVAGLILLVTALPAAAHGGGDRHAGGSGYDKGWAKERSGSDRHNYNHDHRYDRDYRFEQNHRWERRARKHFKRNQRQHRREYRPVVQRYTRPYYAAPLIVGIPQIVFRIDW